jgi:7-cyano-7-deazaguanine synthase
LVNLSKREIIELGTSLNVDYSFTVSCYRCDEQGRACGNCDACAYRREGFAKAGIQDPTRYASNV